jgi:hypothetical protein
VVRLQDGRRFYIESFSGEREWSDDAGIAVEMLPAGQPYPALAPDHYQTLFGWDGAPGLEEYVKRLGA